MSLYDEYHSEIVTEISRLFPMIQVQERRLRCSERLTKPLRTSFFGSIRYQFLNRGRVERMSWIIFSHFHQFSAVKKWKSKRNLQLETDQDLFTLQIMLIPVLQLLRPATSISHIQAMRNVGRSGKFIYFLVYTVTYGK